MKRIVLMLLLVVIPAGTGAWGAEGLKIGMVNDQSGPNKGAGKGLRVGVNAYFKAVNDKGGVNGRTVELVNVDDRYSPDATVDGVLKLVEEQKIFALVGTIGTANGLSILPIVKEYKLPFVGPRSGAANFRTPVIPQVFNIRASHQEEIDKLVDALVKDGAKKISVFYQNDSFGMEIVANTEKALARHGLALLNKGSFERGTTVVGPAVTTILSGAPDAVILGSVYGPGAEFAKAMRSRGAKSKLAAGSFCGGSNLVQAAGPAAEGLIMSQVVPHLSDSDVPVVSECRAAVEKNPEDVGFNSVSLEGCITAKSMILALAQAGNPPTKEGFIKAYEAMHDADLGGIKLNFSPQNHQGQNNVYLEVVQDGKLLPLKEKK